MERTKKIYADNAATTPVTPVVLNAMLPYFCEQYGNASSIYALGRESQRVVEDARAKVAKALGARAEEIFFTSGGSEADNWAIKGVAAAMEKKGKKHLITTVFEHHAVLHTMQSLERRGFEVTYLPVDEKGLLDPESVRNAIREDTALVSVMYANNEIGTIQPIEEIGRICREKKVLFHTDAVQAVGNVPIDVEKQNIGLLSLSAHKLHGPKGMGVLYCRRGVRPEILIDGGGQERGRRAGTENVAGIVGLSVAIEEACKNIEEKAEKVRLLRNRLIDGLLPISHSRLNGDREKRLAGNVNISFEGVEGESLLLMLDGNGICASSGSACTSGSLDPSHVLLAIGLSHDVAHGSLRLTLNEYNTEEEVEYIIKTVPVVVQRLREMSPLWEKIMEREAKEKNAK